MLLETKMEYKVTVIANNQIVLEPEIYTHPLLQNNQVRGRTLVSLISPGTELAVLKNTSGQFSFPTGLGYACVFEIEEIGSNVVNLKVGDKVFYSGSHKSIQVANEQEVVKLPSHLDPKIAVFARLMGVSMSTLTTTTARPPQTVVVTGLGLVGHLAAQIFTACGYQVLAVDPSEEKRIITQAAGLKNIYQDFTPILENHKGKVSLVVECSGHEDAIRSACQVVRKKGEVVMVGVPWSKRSEFAAFDLLHLVFHNFVVLRSGWEWEIPKLDQDYKEGSLRSNYEGAMRWLADNKINVKNLAEIRSPKNPQQTYDDIINQKIQGLSCIFDWQS